MQEGYLTLQWTEADQRAMPALSDKYKVCQCIENNNECTICVYAYIRSSAESWIPTVVLYTIYVNDG
jgi:hypothetical protein